MQRASNQTNRRRIVDLSFFTDEEAEQCMRCPICNGDIDDETRVIIRSPDPDMGIISCHRCEEMARMMATVHCEDRLLYPITEAVLEELCLKDVTFRYPENAVRKCTMQSMVGKNVRIMYPSFTGMVRNRHQDLGWSIPVVSDDGNEGYVHLQDLDEVLRTNPKLLELPERQEHPDFLLEDETSGIRWYMPRIPDYEDCSISTEFDRFFRQILRDELYRLVNPHV